MNIAKMAKTPFLVALFLGTALSGSAHVYAGFEVGSSYASQGSSPAIVSNVQMDGSPLPTDSNPKSLEVFSDRYVPDSVRKKYNLNDDWFGDEVTPIDVQPTQLTPPILQINSNVSDRQSLPPLPQPSAAPAPVEAPAQPLQNVKSLTAQTFAPKDVKEPVESWRGRKGENIREVLQRWSERGGTNLMWASPDSPVLQKEFTYVGKFQDAVNVLIKTEGGDKIHSQYRSEGLNPVMMSPASTVTTNTPPAVPNAPPVEATKPATALSPLAKIFKPEEKKDVKPETRWFALSGAPLAEVIKVWSEDAGVRLIWQSEKNFAVKESISHVGHYEDAVFRALSQYNAEEIRPVGEIYRDPQNGQLILLVRTEVN